MEGGEGEKTEPPMGAGWPETSGLETVRTEWDTLGEDWGQHSRQG